MAAPTGFIHVPDDIRCRCFEQWQEADGSYWCCGKSATVKELAELRRLSGDRAVSAEIIGIRVQNVFSSCPPAMESKT